MTTRNLLHAARWAVLLGATLVAAGVLPFATDTATGQAQPSLVVTAVPIANLTDGALVKVHAAATEVRIFSMTAHVCMPGKVNGDHAFDFAGPFCANVPIGQGEVEKIATFPGINAGDLEMKVGTGSVEWHNTIGFPYSLTCGPGSPCDLVVRVEISDSTAYFQVPLCFGTGCPAAAPQPSNPTAAAISPPPTPTTEPPPTTTTAPPAAAPAGPPGGGSATGSGSAAAKQAGTGTSRSSADPSGQLASAPASAVSIPPVDSSRGARVFAAAIAGALGAVMIVQIVARARRMRTVEAGAA